MCDCAARFMVEWYDMVTAVKLQDGGAERPCERNKEQRSRQQVYNIDTATCSLSCNKSAECSNNS